MLYRTSQTPQGWNPPSGDISIKQMLICFIVLLPLLIQFESYAGDDKNTKIDLWYSIKILLGSQMLCCMCLFLRDIREVIRVLKAQNPTISKGEIFDEVMDIFNTCYIPGSLAVSCNMLDLFLNYTFSVGHYIYPLFIYFGLGFYLQFPYKNYIVRFKHSYLLSNSLALALGYKIFQTAISSI